MTTPIVPSITDEQLAELESICDRATPGARRIESDEDSCAGAVFVCSGLDPHSGGEICRTYSYEDADLIAATNPEAIKGLIARLRAAEKDAARYSWIRDQHNDGLGRTWVAVYQPGEWVSLDTFVTGVKAEVLNLDSAVDTAMEQQP